MEKFLEATEVINYHDPAIQSMAADIDALSSSDAEVAKRCFEFVRDEIRHTGDVGRGMTTLKASEVLRLGSGWCYAKSHLLAALLRANGIPAGFCYQRLSCSEYKEGIYCLHGLNAVYLEGHGWYRIDARGNKQGVSAKFTPPVEQLAFIPQENEFTLPEIYSAPLDIVVERLSRCKRYDDMVSNFPDIAPQETKLQYHVK